MHGTSSVAGEVSGESTLDALIHEQEAEQGKTRQPPPAALSSEFGVF
jgi:hypothetical protein